MSAPHPTATPRRTALRLLFLAVLTMPFWDLGHPLWEVDDARYAQVPREMFERGDWVSPTLNGFTYVEKPPMIYWLGAASYRVFGVSEAAARFPLALLTVMGCLGAWWLGRWLFSPAAGLWAGIVLGSCAEFFALGHLLTPDTSVSVFLLWATGLLLRALLRPGDAAWAAPLAWAMMAGAFFSKGLIAVLLPGAWVAGLAILTPDLRRRLKPLVLGWGPPLFLALIVPWFLAMEARHPGFSYFYIVEEQFLRFLTPRFQRTQPWHFFIPVELVGFLPWTPVVLAAVAGPLWGLLRGGRAGGADPAEESRRSLALWAALLFVFFSLSKSKLVTYLLPAFAHQAVLAGELLERLASARDPATAAGTRVRWARGLAWSLAGLLTAALLASPAILARLPPGAGVTPALAFAGAALLACQAAALGLLGWGAPAPAALAALLAAGWLTAGSRLVTDRLSVKRLAADISARIRPADRLLTYEVYLHGLPFYTGRTVDVVNWTGEFYYARRDPRFAGRFGDDETIRRLPESGRAAFVVLRRRDLAHFLTLNPPGELKGLKPFGDWVLAEL